jgi:hypothetical protein
LHFLLLPAATKALPRRGWYQSSGIITLDHAR